MMISRIEMFNTANPTNYRQFLVDHALLFIWKEEYHVTLSGLVATALGLKGATRKKSVRVFDPEFDCETPSDYALIYEELNSAKVVAEFEHKVWHDRVRIREHEDGIVSIQWVGTGLAVLLMK